MRFCYRRTLFSTLFVVLVLFSCLQVASSNHGVILVFRSLQRGRPPPTGPNPCTHIPGRSSGVCT
ncbi:hypothetical protein D8674_027242 [Pyrus ussuriensis x Pyrus communis]|uniref:Secreted protein n=1 Tax=Pyrus ussuriensis x Pyrus communis TaxID=2448454 RepID=A0A5N5IA82_9ROSA|nr:hypothetical protein D8674_027242 [Pyrus ussuriensis x Pyrus communis]